YNRRLRELQGYAGVLPAQGDKLVCLRNRSEKGLLNGSLWSVSSMGKRRGNTLQALVRSEDEGVSQKVRLSAMAFEDPENAPPVPRSMDAFDFGYALTVHKAQGSQWDHVVLFDESWAFKDYRDRWLYTAITRAAERLTIVR
ncbi:MAG: ATP-binding domain-containing protein, partial [Devosiaceae bacterium]|nr:ATP-binding domain-containing protein [Devosiaceae bacterium MH13]